MINLIYSCLAVLADLRFEGKGFDPHTNGNLAKLGEICNPENKEAFNEAFEILYKIVNKVKE
jgi:hypothetical protein